MLKLYYHQVVRSRLQEQGQVRNAEVQYSGVVDCVKKVIRKEGLPGFYRGCATNLLRTTPSAVITFTSYETIRKYLVRVLPSAKQHCHAQPKPGGRIKPLQELGGTGEEEEADNVTRQKQSNKISPSLPLPNKEQLTARH